MEVVVIVTVLALMQYMYFGFQVGGARQKCGVNAPAVTGEHHFECVNRVHQNTAEQLIVLIPALWMYAHWVNPLWGAGMVGVYIVGRFVYAAAYVKNPAGRSLGFMLSYVPIAIIVIWVLVAAVVSYLK